MIFYVQVNRINTELPILYFKESKVIFSTIMMHFFHEFLFFNFANSMDPGPEVIKLFSMLNSAEHEIYLAHKGQNANNCWHFNIY